MVVFCDFLVFILKCVCSVVRRSNLLLILWGVVMVHSYWPPSEVTFLRGGGGVSKVDRVELDLLPCNVLEADARYEHAVQLRTGVKFLDVPGRVAAV